MTYEEINKQEIEMLKDIGLGKIHNNLIKLCFRLDDLSSSDLRLTRKQWEHIDRMYEILRELGIS